jgi:chromosome segregation ATPase
MRSREVLKCAVALFALLLPVCVRAAQEDAARLELDALVQEGELLQEELDRLTPTGEKLAAEGGRLDAEDQALRAESQSLDRDIQAYNRAEQELEKSAADHRARCPRESEDRALVQMCNARAGEIQAAVRSLEAKPALLQKRQADLNRRIEQYNPARRDWARRKDEHDGQLRLNRRDLAAWLVRVQRYFGGAAFRAARAKAGNPGACAPEALRDQPAAASAEALSQTLGCLRALKE